MTNVESGGEEGNVDFMPLAESPAETEGALDDEVAQPYPVGEPIDPGDLPGEDMGNEKGVPV